MAELSGGVNEMGLSNDEAIKVLSEVCLPGYDTRERIQEYARAQIFKVMIPLGMKPDTLSILMEQDPHELGAVLSGEKPVHRGLLSYIDKLGLVLEDVVPVNYALPREKYNRVHERLIGREIDTPVGVTMAQLVSAYAFAD